MKLFIDIDASDDDEIDGDIIVNIFLAIFYGLVFILPWFIGIKVLFRS